MSNVNLLNHRIAKIHGRLSELYRSVSNSPAPPVELLPTALMELGIVSEALQLVMNELTFQNDKLNDLQTKLEAERFRYQCLSELMQEGYLVTDQLLTIQELNIAAATLLNVPHESAIGRSLSSLIHPDDRALLQTKLSQIHQRNRIELMIRLQNSQGVPYSIELSAEQSRDWETEAPLLRWMLRDTIDCREAEAGREALTESLSSDRPTQVYSKGDVIPLEPKQVWFVLHGMVKLTTLSERGEEMLVGLARDSMIFGSNLTSLQTYQATALSKVQLVSISIAEVTQSPLLAQKVLPLISQRLRQTESFLSVYGQLRVEDRFKHFLDLLRQEIGQPTDRGIRLRARLTHQDFASACCTTRVTITRLLGKLQQEGKISFDSQNHLILKNEESLS
ncbi:helix-turn-helix domain-containing protein [Phormidium tenue FACHB-886]|nr:helix-turn-helix domain-containing protein [Phormidium tenue FACHB-886]